MKMKAAVANLALIGMMPAAIMLLLGCATPAPVDPVDSELERKASAARNAFERGDISRSADLYIEALMRSREIGKAEYIATHAYNVALCHVLLGGYDRALEFLRQARYEMDRAGMNTASAHLVEAEAHLAMGSAEAAGNAAEAALEEALLPEYRAQAHLLLAVLHLNEGDAGEARSEYRRARRYSPQSPLPVQARVEEMLARIAMADGNYQEAAVAYDRVAELFKAGGLYADMAMSWAKAGESYEAMNEDAAAGYRYFLAARSMYGMGETVESLKLVKRAIENAERAQDYTVAEQSALLFKEISNSVKNP